MSEGLSGSLAQLPLKDLLRMLGAGEQSGRIDVVSGPEHGILFLRRGAVVHATADAAVGDAAFAVILGWNQGTFRFDPAVSAAESTIFKPLDQLLAETARQLSEREVLRKAIPSPDVVPHLAATIPGESVTIAAADWEVLAQVDGTKTVAELGRALGRSDLEMVRLLYRLKQADLIGIPVEQAVSATVVFAGQAFFSALTPAVAAAMGPLAEIIIDDTIELLGFTRTTLPRSAMASVTERISMEIRDSAKRVKYQQTMLEFLRGHAA